MKAGRLLTWMSGLRRLGRFEFGMLIVVLLAAAALWSFFELADEVLEGETHAFDAAVLLMLRNPADLNDPIGPPWAEEIGRDITALGGATVLTLLSLIVAGFLVLQRMHKATMLLLVSVGGGVLLSTLLKIGFDRPRPNLVPHGSIVYSASFPSGHAMMAAIVYLTLGALLARIQPEPWFKIYLLVLAVLLTVLVGISRVYLGVHWPTDVLAGWTVGAAWALACWLVARWLQRCGAVESGDEPPDSEGGSAPPGRPH